MARATLGRLLTEPDANGREAKLVCGCVSGSTCRSWFRRRSVVASSAKSATCSMKKRLPLTRTLRQLFKTSLMPDSYPSSRHSDHSSLTRRASKDGDGELE